MLNKELNKFSVLRDILESFPKEQIEYLNNVANFSLQRGWYLHFIYLFQINEEDCIDETFDGYISSVIESEMDDYWELLSEFVPHRKHLWKEAQTCYKEGLYSALIQICYSQADGIFHEIFEKSLFKRGFSFAKEKFGESMESTIDSDAYSSLRSYYTDGSLLKRMLNEVYLNTLLKDKSDLYTGTEKINEDSILLPNRHGVMHGIHFNYGTKLNGCKAIAFLQFIFIALYAEQIGFT